jgi:hypothetical protein
MRLRGLTGVSTVAVFLMLGATIVAGGPAHASTAITCFGSVGCAGQGAATCTSDAQLIEDRQVPGLGDIDLYESNICDTAWATLVVVNYDTGNQVSQLAEIFYEPPQGGPEQFSTASWSVNSTSSMVTTTMVPLDGSVKACGGNPTGTADPFDEDPQGINGLFVNPGTGNEGMTGSCTLWH